MDITTEKKQSNIGETCLKLNPTPLKHYEFVQNPAAQDHLIAYFPMMMGQQTRVKTFTQQHTELTVIKFLFKWYHNEQRQTRSRNEKA